MIRRNLFTGRTGRADAVSEILAALMTGIAAGTVLFLAVPELIGVFQ